MIKYIPNDIAKGLHWYIQIKTRESGPYSYLEVLSMLENQDIEDSHFITYRSLGAWHQVSNFENFTPENIKDIFSKNNITSDTSTDIPFRKSLRVPLSSQVLTILGDYTFKSTCIDLSTGGCLIKLPRGKIKPDSKIKIHFYTNDEIKLSAFNILGEAVRILSAEKLKEGSSYYDLIGVKFKILSNSDKETLRNKIREIVFKTQADATIDRVLKRQFALSAA